MSVVISNMILVAAVVAVGFAVLAYAYSKSELYVTEYNNMVYSDIDKLKETIAFEYIFYNSSTNGRLSVYLLSAGAVGNVNVTTVYVSNSSWSSTFSTISLKYLNGTTSSALKVGEEGYFELSPIILVNGSTYTVKIVTWRGSIFEHVLAV